MENTVDSAIENTVYNIIDYTITKSEKETNKPIFKTYKKNSEQNSMKSSKR